ncbi:MAG: hypothetical protein ACTSX7_20190 [Alphaproteobacteria bacterium]
MARTAAVLVVSIFAWFIYFYAIDLAIMEWQGLPVDWSLMPAS